MRGVQLGLGESTNMVLTPANMRFPLVHIDFDINAKPFFGLGDPKCRRASPCPSTDYGNSGS